MPLLPCGCVCDKCIQLPSKYRAWQPASFTRVYSRKSLLSLSLCLFFLLWQLCLSGFFSIYFLQFSHNTAPSEDWLPRALTHGPFFLVPSAWSGSSSHALKVICWLQLLVKLLRPWQPALLLTERSCQTGWLFQLSQPICSKWRRRRRKSGLCVVGLFFNSKKPSFLFC